MRRLVFTVLAACGASHAAVDAGAGDAQLDAQLDAPPPPTDAGWVVLSENADGHVQQGESVFCKPSGNPPAIGNAWYRAFQIAQPFQLAYVLFASESAHDASVVVNLSSYAGDVGEATLDPTKLAQLATTSAIVPAPATSYAPLVMTLPVGVYVVDVDGTDNATSGELFHLGANAMGETAPSYWASGTCGAYPPVEETGHAAIIMLVGMY